MVKGIQLFPKALSPRPRGRVNEETGPGDAPETGAGSRVSVPFAPMRSVTCHLPFAICAFAHLHICGLAALRLVVLIFLTLGIAYSVLIPPFEMPDEFRHFAVIQHIATHRELPVQPLQPGAEAGPWQQEGSQPPLYYGLAALITSGIDTSDIEQAHRLNPQAALGVVPEDGHDLNLALHNPPSERFPWHGAILAVHLARLLSVVLGAWAIYLGWRLVSALAPKSKWLPLASAATHAFTPMFVFISASVNNDALVVPLSILALLLMLQTLKGERIFPRAEFMTGIVVGLAVLTKEGALALLPLAGATSLWIAWHTTGRPTHPTGRWLLDFCKRLLAWAIPVALIAGWWYWRNVRLYGDWLGLNAFLNVIGTRAFTPGLRELWAERISFMAAYWGNFGSLNIPMPQWIYDALNFGAIIAGVGLVKQFCSWVFNGKEHWLKLGPFSWNQTTAARALALIWPVALFVSVIRWTSLTMASQGRLVFPALPLWSLGLVGGLRGWVPRRLLRFKPPVTFLFPVTLLILSLLALPLWILPAYRPPAAISLEETTGLSNPINTDFGGYLRLLGYELQTSTIYPGDAVSLDLYWQCLAPTATDHLIFIHLLGTGERIVAQRDSFPKRGLISTVWLTPGEAWKEHYLIRVPALAYAPDVLTVSVGVYDVNTGVRLTITGPEMATGDSARFGRVNLAQQPGRVPNPVGVHFGEGMLLKGYDLNTLTPEAGKPLTLTLIWEGAAAMQQNYTVSAQLIDTQWRKAAQVDRWPQDGGAPTSAWRPGQILTDTVRMDISPEAVPGFYDLRLTVYSMTGEGEIQPLPVTWQRDRVAESAVILTQLRVK